MNLYGLAMICFTLIVCVGIICNTVTRVRQGRHHPLRYQYLLDSQRLTFELYSGKQLKEIDDDPAGESTQSQDHGSTKS